MAARSVNGLGELGGRRRTAGHARRMQCWCLIGGTDLRARIVFRAFRLRASKHPIHRPARGENPRTPTEGSKIPSSSPIARKWAALEEKDGKLPEFADRNHET